MRNVTWYFVVGRNRSFLPQFHSTLLLLHTVQFRRCFDVRSRRPQEGRSYKVKSPSTPSRIYDCLFWSSVSRPHRYVFSGHLTPTFSTGPHGSQSHHRTFGVHPLTSKHRTTSPLSRPLCRFLSTTNVRL